MPRHEDSLNPRRPDFNPRQATLHYAADVEQLLASGHVLFELVPAFAHMMACGMVYVGDQLKRIADQLEKGDEDGGTGD